VSDSELEPDESQSLAARTSRLTIVDLDNPRSPKVARVIGFPTDALSLHDVTFNNRGSRAYVAALGQTFILDSTAPVAPKVLATIEDPSINISHGADPTPDGKYLLVTDEQAGAAANGLCNVGGVHVFDLANERAPIKVGYWTLDPRNAALATTNSINLTCTAHVLDYSPDGTTWSNADYAAGVRINSASNVLVRPQELAYFTPDDANTWSAKTYKNKRYLFANDLQRGFDVYRWEPGRGTVDTRLDKSALSFGQARLGTPEFCFNRTT
jgi:hypothetical protein